MRYKIAFFLAGGFLLVGCALKDQLAPDWVQKIGILEDTKKEVFDNGFTLLTKALKGSAAVCVMAWYRVGSGDENPRQVGISNLLAHLLQERLKSSAGKDLEIFAYKKGGFCGLSLNKDYTLYWWIVGKDALREVLRIEAERLSQDGFNKNEVGLVKRNLLEELQKDSNYLEEIEKMLFLQHPYRFPAQGVRETIRSLDEKTLFTFYRKYYIPQNTVLVVAGDIQHDKIASLAERLFGRIRAGKPSVRLAFKEPPQNAQRRQRMSSDLGFDRLLIAFRTGKFGFEEGHVLEVISYLLSSGEGSRLYKRLVKDGLARKVSTRNDLRRGDGVFYIDCELEKGTDPGFVEHIIYQELGDLRRGRISPLEIQRAKNRILADFVYKKESIFQTAYLLGYYQTQLDVGYLPRYLLMVDGVELDDIIRVMERFFKKENRTVLFSKGLGKRLLAKKISFKPSWGVQKFGQIWCTRFDNGLKVLVMEKGDLPLVAIRAFVDAGSVHDPPEKAGLAYLTGRLLKAGIEDLTGKGLSNPIEKIELLGGDLQTGPTGVKMKLLSKDIYTGLDLLRDLLLYPSFPQQEFKRLKKSLISELMLMEKDPFFIGRELFYKNVYGKHPFAMPSIGLSEGIVNITREDCIRHHQKFYTPSNTIIAVVGDVVARKVISALQARFAEWKKTLKIKQVSEPKRLAKPLTIYKPAESEQLHIFVGHLGIRRDDRDFYALELLECILGGAPGCVDRLGMMLYREKRVVRRIFCELSKDLVLQPGVFMVYASTSSEKGPTAREAIFREIQKLRENGVTEEELADAKRYLIRSFLLKSGSVEELAESLIKMERFNLGVDFWERYPGLLRELTKDDLIRVARNYLDTNNYVMVVVGPVDEKGKPVPPKK